MNGDYPHKDKKTGRRQCRCGPVCRRFREMKQVLRDGNRADMRKLIRSLADDLACAELDNNVHSSIMDGSWPSAIERLSDALVRATARHSKQVSA